MSFITNVEGMLKKRIATGNTLIDPSIRLGINDGALGVRMISGLYVTTGPDSYWM